MPGADLRVAVAEDEALPRSRLVRFLQEAGCEVLAEFTNGVSCVEWIRSHPDLDALFLDIQMPGATGGRTGTPGEGTGSSTLGGILFLHACPSPSAFSG